jgi:hypothetical protein
VGQQPFDERCGFRRLNAKAEEGGESSRFMLLERDDRGGVVAVPDAEADVSVVAQVAGGSQSDRVGLDQRVTAEVLDELRSLRSSTVRTEAKAVGELTIAFEAAHHVLLPSHRLYSGVARFATREVGLAASGF